MDTLRQDSSDVWGSTASAKLVELNDRLDELWARYLRRLDEYTTTQASLNQKLASGWIALARANFKASGGIRRYGQDLYHDRPLATRKATVHCLVDGGTAFEIQSGVSDTAESEPPIAKQHEHDAQKCESSRQQPTPPETPSRDGEGKGSSPSSPDEYEASDADSESGDLPDAGESPSKKTKVPLESDPLRWFGVLLPQELRSAQNSFVTAMSEPLAVSANAAKAMREAEFAIRKARKDIRKLEKSLTKQ